MKIVRARRLPCVLPKPRLIRPAGLALDWGSGNRIEINGRLDGSIRLFGRDNHVVVARGTRFTGTITMSGDGNRLIIADDCRIACRIDITGSHTSLTIGAQTTMQSGRLICQEGASIAIGHHCMLSRDIDIRTTGTDTAGGDGRSQTVRIGDHVWIGLGARIGRGAVIADDTIVGARAVVSGVFTENSTIIGGVPARVIERGVTWHRNRQNRFNMAKADSWKGEAAAGGPEPVDQPCLQPYRRPPRSKNCSESGQPPRKKTGAFSPGSDSRKPGGMAGERSGGDTDNGEPK